MLGGQEGLLEGEDILSETRKAVNMYVHRLRAQTWLWSIAGRKAREQRG